MPHDPSRHLSDLRGTARLATDATLGLAALVEAMHARIASPPGVAGPAQTSGITGLVYRSVRGVTRLVGGSVDGLLGALTPLLVPLLAPPARDATVPGQGADETAGTAPWREREAIVAALNGVLGDHLEATANPLAIPMRLRFGGVPLQLESQTSSRLLVLVHGLCMNDLQWQRDGHDHGAVLAREQGWTPLYLHYNTGRHVHANGAEFARCLAALLAAWPVPVARVALVGHSMGGLVIRSALHQGAAEPWSRQIDDAVFIGTPHLGAPLERAGHGVEVLLSALPYAAPLARLARLRSAGIGDLRHGRLLADDTPAPLPAQPRCHAVAASLGPQVGDAKGRLLGDGLVPLASALGRHRQRSRSLAFEADRQVQLQGLGHMDLLSSPAVSEVLLRWLR